MKRPIAIALLLLSIAACSGEDPGRSSAIVIRNDGSTPLGRIMINGVDHGALPPGSVLTLEDVGASSFLIQAYRAGDAVPCDSYQTPVLEKGQNLHHAFVCTRP